LCRHWHLGRAKSTYDAIAYGVTFLASELTVIVTLARQVGWNSTGARRVVLLKDCAQCQMAARLLGGSTASLDVLQKGVC
jgi:hypothetical protein